MKKYFYLTLIVAILSFGLNLKYDFFKKDVVAYESTVVLKEDKLPEVYVKNTVVEKFSEISELYLNDTDFSFEYVYEDNPSYVKEDSNFLKKIVGKEFHIELNMKLKQGIDFSKVDVIESGDNLYFRVNKSDLLALYIPNFEKSLFDTEKGIFRKGFTEEDRRKLYNDSINIGKNYGDENIVNKWDSQSSIEEFINNLLNDLDINKKITVIVK